MNPELDELRLFDPGPASPQEILTKALERPVWSEHKADLIARYLRYFLFITKHGTYVDAFAGPQTEKSPDVWTAEKVLALEPQWLRHFYLFDVDARQVSRLEQLRGRHDGRHIVVEHGDSNVVVPRVLPQGSISEKEATFCLLDQRTFECHWSLCQHIAGLRPGDRKAEQFYFLANSWMDRSIAGTTTELGRRRIQSWLGSPDWADFVRMGGPQRSEYFVDKFRTELKYRSVKSWPIYQREGGAGSVMYYMIHATDHEEAPKLMYRAYVQAVAAPEPAEQLEILVEDVDLSH